MPRDIEEFSAATMEVIVIGYGRASGSLSGVAVIVDAGRACVEDALGVGGCDG